MIVYPYTASTHDSLYRVLEYFRHMHLRHLPVLEPADNSLVGIITRKDLFAYMHL